MKVSNNPNKVIFYRPTNHFQDNQQHFNTRSSSFYGQKRVSNFNEAVNKQVKIPKKVSFHYSNGKQTSLNSNVLIYPPSFPQMNNISGESVQNRKRFQSDYSKNSHDSRNAGIRMCIQSIEQKSQKSKNSVQNVVNSIFLKQSEGMFINYPPNKSLKQLPNNVKNQQQFARQRSQSVLSQKSSTKIILQTVRQLNPDGSRGAPVEIKQRIQTQYLTNFNNNRQNYHIISHQPKQIIINQQYVQSPQPFVRNFYSPQNVSTFSTTQQSQRITESFSKNQNQQQTAQSINVNAKSSDLFSYPVRNSFQNLTHLNGFKTQNVQRMKQERKNSNLKSYTLPRQSKIQSNLKLDSRKIQSYENTNLIENHKLKGIHQIGFTQKSHQNGAQKNFIHKTTEVKDRMSSKYQATKQFYSISQKMIDQIFRNQTEKALLKMNETKHSPRQFHSPNLRRYNKN